MILTVLGVVLVHLGVTRRVPLALLAGACLGAGIVVGAVHGVWWGGLVALGTLAACGTAANAKLLSRPDAFAVAWGVSAAGPWSPAVLCWIGVFAVGVSAVALGPKAIGVVRKRAFEAVTSVAAVAQQLPIGVGAPEHDVRVPLWPVVIGAALMTWLVGGPDLAGIASGGSWWTTSSLVI